jgi:hypothetical protein
MYIVQLVQTINNRIKESIPGLLKRLQTRCSGKGRSQFTLAHSCHTIFIMEILTSREF